jgi:DNA polymerase III alpha subunit
MIRESYIPLHCHSHFSLLKGVPSPEQLVQKAGQLGYSALALTDINSMSGCILFLEAARKAGIKPILGVELYNPDDPDDSVVLLARNAVGYEDLCELTTRRHSCTTPFRIASLFHNMVSFQNLIALCASATTLQELAKTPLRSVLYAELINAGELSRKQSRACFHLAKQLQIPLVAQHPVYFLEKADYDTYMTMRAIDLNTNIPNVPQPLHASCECWFMPNSAVHKKFTPRIEWLMESVRIADSCKDSLQASDWILPQIQYDNGDTPHVVLQRYAEQGLLKNYGMHSASHMHYEQAKAIQQKELSLIERKGYSSYFLTVKKIRDTAGAMFSQGFRHYKDTTILRGSAANSITLYNIGASDLDPIEHNLYFERFLNEDRSSPPDADMDFGWDEREAILKWIVEEWGADHTAILCTTNCFRWRSAFRETAKVFGYSTSEITTLYKQLQQQSHLRNRSIQADELPDIQLQKVLTIARTIHGKPHYLGQHPGGVIITHKPIWRHVACQYTTSKRRITQIDMHNGVDFLGLIKYDILGNGSLSVVRDALHMLQDQGYPNPHLHRTNVCQQDPQVQEIMRNGQTKGVFYIESPAQTRLNQKATAQTLSEIGITSSLVRPAGAQYTSLFVQRHRQYKQAQNIDGGVITSDSGGAITSDSGGASASDSGGASASDNNGNTTSNTIANGNSHLHQNASANGNHHLHQNASANNPMHHNANISANENDWEFLHPSLQTVLGDTHDVVVFQEDIIRLCVEIAHMSFKQADQVRKMMNSMHEGVPPNYHETAHIFMQGCIQHSGYTPEQAQQLWERVQSFRGFSFCKSHSLSYAQLSFKCAWLKVHYPAQFLAAVIRNQHGFYATNVYMDEAKRWGILVRGPCINASGYFTYGEHCIQLGFQHIKGLPKAHGMALEQERLLHGAYSSLQNLVQRTYPLFPLQSTLPLLIQCGALDVLHANRPYLLMQLHMLLQNRHPPRPYKHTPALSNGIFVAHESSTFSPQIPPPCIQAELPLECTANALAPVADYPLHQKCKHELELLGCIVSIDILDILKYHPARQNAVCANALHTKVKKRCKVFGTIIAKRSHSTAKHELMLFLTLQDETGTIDVIFWPNEYKKWHSFTYSTAPIEVWGTVLEEYGTYTLQAQRVQFPQCQILSIPEFL